ncbi:hypothetical protein ACVW07_000679 [Cellulomonas sp. URHB0016]
MTTDADTALALQLSGTIRHDGNGGVADDLTTPAALGEWLAARPELPQPVTSDGVLADVLSVRQAVRALFARAVRAGAAEPRRRPPADPRRRGGRAPQRRSRRGPRRTAAPVVRGQRPGRLARRGRTAGERGRRAGGDLGPRSDRTACRSRPRAAARLPRPPVRPLLPAGARSPGVLQDVVQQPGARRPALREAQGRGRPRVTARAMSAPGRLPGRSPGQCAATSANVATATTTGASSTPCPTMVTAGTSSIT